MKKLIVFFIVLFYALPGLAASYKARVVDVIDGDTIIVADSTSRKTLNLAFIDCPEPGQPFAVEAANLVRETVLNRDVAVITKGKNFLGDVAAEVVLLDNGRSLNYALVRKGLAWPDSETTNAIVNNMSKSAKQARTGLWSQHNPTPPWHIRKFNASRIQAYAQLISGVSDSGSSNMETPTGKAGSGRISTASYDINISARQSRDFVEFSGRIKNGPACEKLLVAAHARSNYGGSARAEKIVSFSEGVNSRTFDGNYRYPWRDRSRAKPEWTVTWVNARCL